MQFLVELNFQISIFLPTKILILLKAVSVLSIDSATHPRATDGGWWDKKLKTRIHNHVLYLYKFTMLSSLLFHLDFVT